MLGSPYDVVWRWYMSICVGYEHSWNDGNWAASYVLWTSRYRRTRYWRSRINHVQELCAWRQRRDLVSTLPRQIYSSVYSSDLDCINTIKVYHDPKTLWDELAALKSIWFTFSLWLLMCRCLLFAQSSMHVISHCCLLSSLMSSFWISQSHLSSSKTAVNLDFVAESMTRL